MPLVLQLDMSARVVENSAYFLLSAQDDGKLFW
jgi:hypothetical protein